MWHVTILVNDVTLYHMRGKYVPPSLITHLAALNGVSAIWVSWTGYKYVFMCVHVSTCVCMCVHVCTSMCMHVYICMYMYVCMCLCFLHACVHVYVRIYVCVCVQMHVQYGTCHK